MDPVARALQLLEHVWAREEDGPEGSQVTRVHGFRAEDNERAVAEGWRHATHAEIVGHFRKQFEVAGQPSPGPRAGLPDHAGEHAWILGSGPSIADAPLELLRDRLTIGVNRILRHERLTFPPTYVAIIDQRVLEWEAERLAAYRDQGGRLILKDAWDSPIARAWPADRLFSFRVSMHAGWSHDPEHGFASNYTTVSLALQFAAWCGVAVANLVGVDMAHAPDGRTHWFGQVPMNVATDARLFACMGACYELSRPHAADAGLGIVACSPAFTVPGFERVSLEETVRRADGASG